MQLNPVFPHAIAHAKQFWSKIKLCVVLKKLACEKYDDVAM